jgi:hypothetical protein
MLFSYSLEALANAVKVGLRGGAARYTLLLEEIKHVYDVADARRIHEAIDASLVMVTHLDNVAKVTLHRLGVIGHATLLCSP